MKTSNLTLNESAANGGFTHRIEIGHADLTETTTNTAQVLEALTLPAGAVVLNVAAKLITPFKDASDNAFNNVAIEIGDGADTDRYLASTQINENGTEIDFAAGSGAAAPTQTGATVATANGSDAATTQALANALKVDYNKTITDVGALITAVAALQAARGHAYVAADTLDIKVGSMSAKSLSDIDTGLLHVFVTVAQLNTLSEAID
tara:strand:- start:891 stop:1511 length:621 start_codon:yes stop_codon:yes gene_type:complete